MERFFNIAGPCVRAKHYMDRLGRPEGWLVVADSDLTKPWDAKISSETVQIDGRTIHVVCC